MRIECLKLFCDVVRLRSFSQAARLNGLSQSAASQAMLQLERTLGVNLIDRSTRPLQTTELGKVYYRGCKKMLDEYTDLEASIRQEGGRMEVSVQVAAIYSVGLRDMGQYVARIRRSYRNAEVHIDYLHPDRVYRRVLEGTADLGLVSFPRNTRELTTRPWRDEPMVLVCPPGHRLAHLTRVHPKDLATESYIGFEKGLVIRREVDRFLREQGVAVNVVLEFDNIENIKEAVEVGAGVALLPEPTLIREVRSGTLAAVPLVEPGMVRPLGVIIRRHARLSLAAHRFMDLLQNSGNHNGDDRSARPAGGKKLRASGRRRRPRGGSARFRPGRTS